MIGVSITTVTAARIVIEESASREHYANYADYAPTTKRIIPSVT
ncbi:MAG: hypothetical protein R3C68_04195 [Myxococcota bacterium]